MKIALITTITCLSLLLKNSICWRQTALTTARFLRPEKLSSGKKQTMPLQMVAQIGKGYDFSSAAEGDEEFDPYYEMDCVMKFGGKSLANADRVEHVAQMVKDQIKTGYRPRATVCSAIGENTNKILWNAGEAALEGRGHWSIDPVRSLFVATMIIYNLPDQTRKEVNELLDNCELLLIEMDKMSTQQAQILPQSKKSSLLDQLIRYGELCSAHIVAARLNQIGVPALALDTFTEIDPSVVAVVTGSASQIGSRLGIDEIQVFNNII